MPATPRPELPTLQFDTDEDWRRWLAEHHDATPGVWIKFAKKRATITTVTHDQALETAICFGWIDGQVKPLDDIFWRQRFTPRGPKSRWSQINRAKAEQLIDDGRMQPAGLARIEAARADGRWDAAYEAQSAATVPDDLRRALEAEPAAREFFATLTGQRRYAFLHRLHHVKTPEARARRIDRYLELLREGKTLN
ncbi:MAG TPA: YdeI/OmpD-associated family protein [Solirubrobacteraceae bacterium]|jgi:uncharacterized protein YdeI (YjbR/CyaY-like superfamily)|nr:YdeI/OmpD-associated family protein [Solirubrobacteraceae bacterium]